MRRVVALAAVLAASVIGQVAILQHGLHPLIFPDSREYLALAHAQHGFGHFFDTKRTPGYPIFLGMIALADSTPRAVAMVQVVIALVTNVLAFMVASRLTGSLVAGAVTGVLVGANPWVTQWEHPLLTEAIGSLLLIIVARLYIHLLENASWPRAAGVGGLSATLILLRPAFLPIAVALALPALWSSAVQRSGRLASCVVVMLITSYVPIAGYAVGNAIVNRYPGISTTSNVNIFGATYLDLGLAATSGPAACAGLAPLARAERNEDPYAFLSRHPEFASTNQTLLLNCGIRAIRDRPLEFLGGVTARFFTVAVQAPTYYFDDPHVDTRPFKRPAVLFKGFHAWMVISYFLAAIGVGVLLVRRQAGPAIYGLSMVAVAQLMVVAALGPSEFYRLRAPVDPLVTTLAVVSMWRTWGGRLRRSSPPGSAPSYRVPKNSASV